MEFPLDPTGVGGKCVTGGTISYSEVVEVFEKYRQFIFRVLVYMEIVILNTSCIRESTGRI